MNINWTNDDGNHDGGVSYGVGYCINWQRGSLENGRNGAFLLEVLDSCQCQLMYYQDSKFACDENAEALDHLTKAIAALESRKNKRKEEGKLGTHQV